MQSRDEADRLMEQQHYPAEYEDCNKQYDEEDEEEAENE